MARVCHRIYLVVHYNRALEHALELFNEPEILNSALEFSVTP